MRAERAAVAAEVSLGNGPGSPAVGVRVAGVEWLSPGGLTSPGPRSSGPTPRGSRAGRGEGSRSCSGLDEDAVVNMYIAAIVRALSPAST